MEIENFEIVIGQCNFCEEDDTLCWRHLEDNGYTYTFVCATCLKKALEAIVRKQGQG